MLNQDMQWFEYLVALDQWINCVHIGWDLCPAAGFQANCVGKEGYPTLVFEAIVSYTRRIMAVTKSFFGTWNEKTIMKMRMMLW